MKRKTPPRSHRLTHIDEQGRARMVDVGAKPVVRRTAIAEAFLRAAPGTIDAVLGGKLPKGDAPAVARIAGVLAAKRCDELIPLCHTLPLDDASVAFERAGPGALRIIATASATARTGVEIEALTAALIAAVALYDMAKAIDKNIEITDARVVSKTKSEPAGLTAKRRPAARPRTNRG